MITSTNGTALWVEGTGGVTNDNYGIQSIDDDSDAVFGWSRGTRDGDTGITGRGDHGYGVYGFTMGSGQFGGYFADPIYVHGGCTGCTMSYVARNASTQVLRPGDVTRAAGVDTSLALGTPVIRVMSATSDAAVLGVVLGRVGMVMVEGGEDVQKGPHFGPVGGTAQPNDYLVVVVQGLAQVRVDTNSRMQAGDLAYLGAASVTSTASGPIVGMAVDKPDNDGMAWVLVGSH